MWITLTGMIIQVGVIKCVIRGRRMFLGGVLGGCTKWICFSWLGTKHMVFSLFFLQMAHDLRRNITAFYDNMEYVFLSLVGESD